jgi:15-cis-phytoene desaturase
MAQNNLKKKVVIIGGGIGGLSAAHELLERGFEVEVYEKNSIPGGKARSMDVKDSASGNNRPLPAEHGFRFFPGFYSHITDTMKRIPYKQNPNGVFDNLKNIELSMGFLNNAKPTELRMQLGKNIDSLYKQFTLSWDLEKFKIPQDELEFYFQRLWQFLTSSKKRLINEYEKISWWDFIEAKNKSTAYKNYLGKGMTTQLVASRPQHASARTVADVGLRLILDSFRLGKTADRVLNGPTNTVWINPWLEHIKNLGGLYFTNHELSSIELTDSKVSEVSITDMHKSRTFKVKADYFVLALPVEVITKYLSPKLLAAAPELVKLYQLQNSVSWMNGIQFYLSKELNLIDGHLSFLDSEWAISGIQQTNRIWDEFDLTTSGNGQVKAILSLAISDWDTPGSMYNKPARDCSREEIAAEVIHQIKTGFNQSTAEFNEELIIRWYLDPDISESETNPYKHKNAEPLLVNLVNTWHLRPNAYTSIPNMFLSADYVRTNTDLATMEGANEAARRAVNEILKHTESTALPCQIWDWDRPAIFKPLIWYDAWRYNQGLPWGNAPEAIRLGYRLVDKLLKLNPLKGTPRS